MRTWAGPEALADVTSDASVTAVDVPRRLEAGSQVGQPPCSQLPDFVTANRAVRVRAVLVAVIDPEVARQHPALRGRVVHRRNYTSEPWGNPDPHGTAVAGIVAADDEDAGGVAPEAEIYNYKVLASNRFLHADDFSGAIAVQHALEDGAASPTARGGPARSRGRRVARRSRSMPRGRWAWWW